MTSAQLATHNAIMISQELSHISVSYLFFFFQAEDGIRDDLVTGVQTCALPIFIGAEFVAKAAPDGSTFLYTSSHTVVVVPLLYDKLPYDPIHDFVPVALCCSMAQAIVVNATLPVGSVKQPVPLPPTDPPHLTHGPIGPAPP